MKTILVTGASGFLGWNVCKFRPINWRIVGTYHAHKEGLFPKTEYLQLDLTDKDQTWRALKAVRPDAVFHLAAVSNTNQCEQNPEMAYLLNVAGTATLAEMCADLKIRLLFCSSEQVYDGLKEQYSELDLPAPKNEYGKQKLAAENQLSEIYPEAAIARIAVLFGQGSPASPSFLQQWLDAWQKFFPVTAFHDEIRSFLSGQSAAEGLFLLLEQDAIGVFNVSGATTMSRYDFALLAKNSFHLDVAPIESKSQKEVEMAAFRPPCLALDNHKISSIGFRPRHASDELKRLAKEIELPPLFSEN